MLMVRAFTVLTVCVIYGEAKKNIDLFLVPEELPTILNIIYSRLPPIKIGSDQRFGLGFRLGRNVDAQILVELGPQSETQSLGDNPSKREDRRGKYLGGRTSTTTTEDPAWNAVDSNTNEPQESNEINTEDPVTVLDRLVANLTEQESTGDYNENKPTSGRTVVEQDTGGFRRSIDGQNESEPFISTFMKWLSSFFHQR